MITVYVGDVTEYLGMQARQYDSTATLIDTNNYSNLKEGTYYTSVGDVGSLYNFAEVLRQANRIIYTPPKQWSDKRWGQSKMQTWTEDYLEVFSHQKPVDNFAMPQAQDKDTMLQLVDHRQTESPQLWAVGCSYTYGVGVKNTERYGEILSKALDLPVSVLAYPGSSLTWQADQILRSDVRKDDLVVWGLTSHRRFPYYKNNKLIHACPRTYESNLEIKHDVDISFLDSQQLVYQAVLEIYQVINFCNKVGAQLILAQLLGRGMEQYLASMPNFTMLSNQFGRDADNFLLDFGDDGIHPGPNMHKWYADQILNKLEKN